LDPAEARGRFAAACVARLATADAGGRPHIVPVTFALDGDGTIVTAVDHKPKRTRALKRLANIAENPRVTLLVDHYADDWEALWWARADGTATVAEPGTGEAEHAAALLAERYAQYRERPPEGPAISVAVERWSGWTAAG
jgi:PPOX class probable F420-dependent enzyme